MRTVLSPEEVDLVADLRKVAELMPGVAFDIVMETLTPEREHEFGQILIALGEIISNRAERRSAPEQREAHDMRNSLTKRVDGLTERSQASAADKPGSQ